MGRLDAVFHGTCGQGVGLSAEVMGTVPLYHGPRAPGTRVRASLCRCARAAIIKSVFQRRPKGTLMPLPPPVEALWNELQSVRAEILKEVEGLSQGQADWRPSEQDWSVGEIIHHLTLAEVATGKLTSKLLKEAGATVAPFPPDLTGFAPLPPWPPGPGEAPPVVRPEHGHRLDDLTSTVKATRERSRQSIERLATADPRSLKWRHFSERGSAVASRTMDWRLRSRVALTVLVRSSSRCPCSGRTTGGASPGPGGQGGSGANPVRSGGKGATVAPASLSSLEVSLPVATSARVR